MVSTTVWNDAEWMSRLDEKFAGVVAQQPEWAGLRDMLLSVGGGAVAACYEEDMTSLTDSSKSQSWDGSDAMFKKGRPNSCHSNAAAYYERYGHPLVTGWALSPDGCWRQHSWNLHKKTGRVIESTVMRVAYYGFVIEGDALDDFLFYNY